MRVIVGSETGICKVVAVEAKATVAKWGAANRDHGVHCLNFVEGSDEGKVLVARSSGVVEMWDISNTPSGTDAFAVAKAQEEAEKSGQIAEQQFYGGGSRFLGHTEALLAQPLAGLCSIDESSFVVCSQTGQITTFKWNYSDDRGSEIESCGDFSCFKQLQAEQRVKVARSSRSTAGIVGFAGEEIEVQLWDINSSSRVWKAKNVPHDWLRMRVPVCVNDFQFAHDNDNCLNIVTGYGQLRMYDRRVKNRPVFEKEIHKNIALQRLVSSPCGTELCLSDIKGGLFSFDLRKRQICARYKGIPGAVRAVKYHSSSDFKRIACTGLDRYVRVYDATSRILNAKPAADVTGVEHSAADGTDADSKGAHRRNKQDEEWGAADEKLWQSLPVVKDRKQKKARKRERETQVEEEDDDEQELALADQFNEKESKQLDPKPEKVEKKKKKRRRKKTR